MKAQWTARIRGYGSSLQIKAFRSWGRFVRYLSTVKARNRLKNNGPIKVLVDSTVLANAITHETAWISTGKAKWGPHEYDMGYAARVPIHAEDCDLDCYPEIKFLLGIAHLARSGHLQLFNSAELMAEQFRQPIGRFRGYGYDDLNLFSGIDLKSVDGLHLVLVDAKEKQLDRINSCSDPLFCALVDALGQKNSFDAYHIFTAEKFGMFCFLHVDLKLDGRIKEKKKHPALAGLHTKILLPSQLGALLNLRPMSPRLLSHEGASFFVRPDLHVPGQQRRRPPRSSRV